MADYLQSSSSSSDEVDKIPTVEELCRWKKDDLQTWLHEHGLKKSGNKEILARRIHRHMTYEESDDCSVASNSTGVPDDIPPVSDLTNGWIPLTTADVPPISNDDVENYFLHRKHPTSGRMLQCHRQLTKSRKMSNESFVYDFLYHSIDLDSNYCYFKTKCRPSMRKQVSVGGKMTTFYSICVTLVKKTGLILHATCTCKAGLSGVCSHVGATVLDLVKQRNACTSIPCNWAKPKQLSHQKDHPKIWQDITFSKTEKENSSKTVRPYKDIFQAGPCVDPDVFCAQLLEDLGRANQECVLFKTMCCQVSSINNFMDLFEVNFCYADHVNIESQECINEFTHFVNSLVVSQDMADHVELATKGQAANKNWKEARTVIMTSSNFGSICKRRSTTPPDNLIRKLRGYIAPPEGLKSLQHGRKYEARARREYAKHHQRQCGCSVTLTEHGLRINPEHPYLGTSVDGIVTCEKCGTGVLEIKCPYGRVKEAWRNMTPQECAENSTFMSKKTEEGVLMLKENNDYYFQIMGQMTLTQNRWCDFVIWTKKGLSVERIQVKESFCQNMLSQLKNFYVNYFVSELFTKRVHRGLHLLNE